MVEMLARNWGWVALRGVAALLFGILVLFNPLLSLTVLVLFFGAYALVDGVFTAVAAVANRREEPYWVALLVSGILGAAVGILTFFWPGVTALVLVYLIAAWATVVGIGEIAAAIRLRKVIAGEWVLVLTGVISIAFGVGLALFPGAGALALVVWIGALAILLGVLRIAFALRLRGWHKERGRAAA
jgi:uncharacterized membrane protein HdeD (DUF308 family)